MAELKPDYYKNNDGKDLFDQFEAGLMAEGEVRGFYKGNIYKYVTRYEAKNGIEDLDKANEYLTRLIRYEHVVEQKRRDTANQQMLSVPGGSAAPASSDNKHAIG